MSKLLVEDLLVLGRKTVLAAITRAFGQQNELRPWPLVIDATAGNGNDTQFLAQAVEENGLVLAFDVQSEAISSTRRRLEETRLSDRVRLVHDNHDRVRSFVTQGQVVAAAMFNLGFLPGAHSDLTTKADTTVAALMQIESLTMPGGVISVHCYQGHDSGEEESAAVLAWMSKLPWASWRVARYEFCNKEANGETLFLAQRM